MLTARHPAQYLMGCRLTTASLLETMLTPGVAVFTLLSCIVAFNQVLSGPYLILLILVFAVTFPGRFTYGRPFTEMVLTVLANWLMVVSLLLLLGWSTLTLEFFNQDLLLTWAIATPITLLGVQLLLPRILPLLVAAEGGQRIAVIAGCGQLSRQLAAGIEASPLLGIRIAGYFDDRIVSRDKLQSHEEILGSIDQLASYVKSHPVDMIYITLPMASQPRIVKLLDELRDTTVSVYFTPDIFLSDLIQARLDTVGGIPVVAVCETPFYGINGPLKRASDLVIASLILVMIAPLMLLIALAIKLESPGPAIFKQRRYGLDGQEIIVYKFRSMRVTEDGDVIRQATRNDSRITPLGSFLRRSSLDELPQFINVLQGTMSVVGPRPHAVAHNEQYRKLINGYMIRHKVKPGITGWAQVNGSRGETDTLEKMQKRIDFDLAYLRNWSLRWDLEIILKTIFVVWKHKNAY